MVGGTSIVGGALGLLLVSSPAIARAEAGTVYINFDGVILSRDDADDSSSNITAITEMATTLRAFGGDTTERATILEAVRTDFEPFAVRVVDQRPASGEYIMAVVTPTNPFGEGVVGVAVNDCDDAAGRRDVVFAFFGGDDAPALTVASTISQEVGHSIGLEHVDDAADLLYPIATGADAYFNDSCIDLSSASSCPDQHRVFCEDEEQQNSYAELLDAFGVADDDATPPSVQLLAPDDDEIVAGRDLELLVDAEDDTFVDRVELWEGDERVGEDRAPPYAFTVRDLEEGVYEVYAVAVDAAGNESRSETLELEARAEGIPYVPGPPVRRGPPPDGCSVHSSAPGTPMALLVLLALFWRTTPCERSARRSRRRLRRER